MTPEEEKDDELTREIYLRCANCGHAQAIHCNSTEHVWSGEPCGCLAGMPDEPDCYCEVFVRPT